IRDKLVTGVQTCALPISVPDELGVVVLPLEARHLLGRIDTAPAPAAASLSLSCLACRRDWLRVLAFYGGLRRVSGRFRVLRLFCFRGLPTATRSTALLLPLGDQALLLFFRERRQI